jgi:tRNA A37 threonylcarbamoyladenosine dehydratase
MIYWEVSLFRPKINEILIYVGNPDFVIDAIDNINTKIDLMKYCYEKKLNVISSMGAGAKADPSRIQIADISETFGK